jgi:hypothetical protein
MGTLRKSYVVQSHYFLITLTLCNFQQYTLWNIHNCDFCLVMLCQRGYAYPVRSVTLLLSHSVIYQYDCWSSSHSGRKTFSQSSWNSVGWSVNSRYDSSLMHKSVNQPATQRVSQSISHPARYSFSKRSGGQSSYQFLPQSTSLAFNQFASQYVINHVFLLFAYCCVYQN